MLENEKENSDKTTTTEETQNKNEVGVPNVNGNIPDTTNSIDLSTHKKDTTMNPKDSVKQFRENETKI